MEFVDLEFLLQNYNHSVKLNSNLELRTFRDYTHKLIKEYNAHMQRHDSEYKPPKKKLNYQWIEHLAMLGAIASVNSSEYGVLYDIGCGIAIPSLTYTLLTGRKSVAVDNDQKEIEMAKRISMEREVNNTEFLLGDYLDVMPFKKLKPGDVVLMSNPDYNLIEYWLATAKETRASMLVSVLPHILFRMVLNFDLSGSELQQLFDSTGLRNYLRDCNFERIFVSKSKYNPYSLILFGKK